MVLLARPGADAVAGMWREMLARKGIHALVKNRDALSAQYNAPGPWWAYEIHVLNRDLERAREILGIEAAE